MPTLSNTIITLSASFPPFPSLKSDSLSLSPLSISLNSIVSRVTSTLSLSISLTPPCTAMKHQPFTLQRSTSTITTTTRTTRSKIIPSNSNHIRSFSTTHLLPQPENLSDKLLIPKHTSLSSSTTTTTSKKLSSLFHSLLNLFSFPLTNININIPTCKWLSIPTHLSIIPSLGRKVTGTLFGHRRGLVSFSVQLDPRSEPLLVLELAMSTSSLVKEMSSGLVRIALECEKVNPSPGHGGPRARKLFQEPTWTMYCNGRKCGFAVSRMCREFDCHVLSTVQSVSVGAGVIPMVEQGRKSEGSTSEGELLYMRARFERVVGSRDSEAFYMMNPDGNGGPELSIFLLRI